MLRVESGTGAVHTAPAHGPDDFMMAKQFHLPLDNPVGNDGCFTAATPIFAGLHVNKVNEKIMSIAIARRIVASHYNTS